MGIKFDVIFESSVFRYPRPRESRDIFLASDWLSGSARKETRRENSTGRAAGSRLNSHASLKCPIFLLFYAPLPRAPHSKLLLNFHFYSASGLLMTQRRPQRVNLPFPQ